MKTDEIGKQRMRRKRRLPKRQAKLMEEKPARQPGQPSVDGGAPRLMKVALQTDHCINGVNYGPGEIEVEEGLAKQLLEDDHRAVEEEQKFYGKRAFIVGPRLRGATCHKLIKVPYETFEEHVIMAEPIVPKPNPVG